MLFNLCIETVLLMYEEQNIYIAEMLFNPGDSHFTYVRCYNQHLPSRTLVLIGYFPFCLRIKFSTVIIL
jgi:hypothetical protein